MYPWLFILISITAAAFVGGVTNHFAIKMLFHPRREYRLRGMRVPFTPGLIPKRKPEIAASLGQIVSSYLVTAEGLRELLAGGAFRESAFAKITARLHAVASREPGLTPGELARRWWSEEELSLKKQAAVKQLHEWTAYGADWLWDRRGWSERRLSELVPGWSDEAVRSWSGKAEQLIIESLKDEIKSPDGQKMLRKLTGGLLDKAGGFLGALAGIFMDEDKMLQRLTPVLLEQLDSATVRNAVRGMIEKQLRQAGEWTLEDTIARISGDEAPLDWLKRKAEELLRFGEWLDRVERADISQWLKEHEELWQRWLRRLIAGGLDLAEKNMHRIIEAIALPKLVKEQVEKFPVERLEQIILSVSGKEFRAITWLGALLGGLIGLMQSTLILWMQ
ncbi:DUF445 family protein [Paenibacillus tarimensis]